jgi:predicted RNA-binding Zn-ribbon protein involved in translation (DUF1610 family)
MSHFFCPNCGPTPQIQQASPLAGAAAVGTLAHAASNGNPFITALGVIGGLWLGIQAANHCATCGAALQIAEDIEPFLGL